MRLMERKPIRLHRRRRRGRSVRERQREHLERVAERVGWRIAWDPEDCSHNHCTDCHGTGVKLTGERCVHHLSCSCSRCTPRC